MTLMEVMFASIFMLAVVIVTFAGLMQSRRLTEGSVAQNMALTIAEGYMEQIKSMTLINVVGGTTDTSGNLVLTTSSYSIPTQLDANTSDPLYTSTGSPPALSSLTPGTSPSGVVDNLKNFVVNSSVTPTQTTWQSVWPNANNYPTTTVGRTDLKMNIWVWVTDLSGSTSKSAKAYGITMIYTWQFTTNGITTASDSSRAYGTDTGSGGTSYGIGSVRTIRSSVPSF